MRSLLFRGSLLVPAFACFIAAAAVEVQSPENSPWTQVPELTTGCYSGQDDFLARVEAAKTTVAAEHAQQDEINNAIRDQVTDMTSTDPMELARRMQEQMLADPQNAAKYAQEMQTLGQQARTEIPAAGEKSQAMQDEADALIARYEADLAKAHTAADARWTALKQKMGIAPDSTHPGESGVPDWAWQEWDLILRERDAADLAACTPYFGENGKMHAQLQRYRDYLVNEQIPQHKKYLDEAQLENYRMTNIPADDYRTTADYEAVEDYLDMAYELFNQRRQSPRCTQGQRCY